MTRDALLQLADGPTERPMDPAEVPDGTTVLLTAILAELQAIRVALTYDDRPACPHPENRRLDMSAMGVTEWTCKDCGHHERRERRQEVQA